LAKCRSPKPEFSVQIGARLPKRFWILDFGFWTFFSITVSNFHSEFRYVLISLDEEKRDFFKPHNSIWDFGFWIWDLFLQSAIRNPKSKIHLAP
jgi:hypothetical protein